MDLAQNPITYLKKNTRASQDIQHDKKKEARFSNSLYEASITLISQQDKDHGLHKMIERKKVISQYF